jgi:hypothetical protein
VRTVEFPGIHQPMLVVSFPEGAISASSSPTLRPMTSSRGSVPGLSCADDPAAVHQAAVRHPGHPYYFMIPGGQMFTIAPTS